MIYFEAKTIRKSVSERERPKCKLRCESFLLYSDCLLLPTLALCIVLQLLLFVCPALAKHLTQACSQTSVVLFLKISYVL